MFSETINSNALLSIGDVELPKNIQGENTMDTGMTATMWSMMGCQTLGCHTGFGCN